ncbi:MAG: GNAT family N-acetyltransferase [Planctomycetota bacterium]
MANTEIPVPLELIEEARMTPSLDAAIRKLLCACFPGDEAVFAASRLWHGTAPAYTFVARQGEAVGAHIGVVIREVSCGGKATVIAGIQNMAVAPALRKSGVSRRLMTEAMAEAARRGIRFGLLFCVPQLERFYASLGWKTLVVRVVMTGEDGGPEPLPAKNIAMSLDLADAPFPAGDIALQGRDW